MLLEPEEQLVGPSSPRVQSYEERISQVRLWTLLPVLGVPLLAWRLTSDHLAVPSDVSQVVSQLLTGGLPIVWWLLAVAPRPYSVPAAIGRCPDRAGWGLAAQALFGASCLRLIWWLSPHAPEIMSAVGRGLGFSFSPGLVSPEPFKIFATVVLMPVAEELIFRGTLFRKWRVRWGPVTAVLLSSCIFGVLHDERVTSVLMGVTLALLYTRTGSLLPALVVHGANNAVAALSNLRPKLIQLDRSWEYAVFALVLLIGVAAWLHFVLKSWRTLGAPLPPDSLNAAPVAVPAALEPAR